MEGYDVRTASDGRLGLRLYQESPVDLVITDVLMPEMDGLEVIGVLAGALLLLSLLPCREAGIVIWDFWWRRLSLVQPAPSSLSPFF